MPFVLIGLLLFFSFIVILASLIALSMDDKKYPAIYILIISLFVFTTLLGWSITVKPPDEAFPIEYATIEKAENFYIFTDPKTNEIINANRQFGVSTFDPTTKVKITRGKLFYGGILWERSDKYELQ